MLLDNRVALITGAGRGIGRAIALAYAAEGARLVLASRTPNELEEVVEKAREIGAEAIAVTADVSSETAVERMTRQALERFSTVDILVNNAAIVGPIGPLEDTDAASWIQTINVNLIGTYLCCRAVLPAMLRQNRGKIINMTSGTSDLGAPINTSTRHMNAYFASKAAVISLTERLSLQLADTNIEVNALHPGGNTRMLDELIVSAEAMGNTELAGYTREVIERGEELMVRSVELALFLAGDGSKGLRGRLFRNSDDLAEIKAKLPEIVASRDAYRLRRSKE